MAKKWIQDLLHQHPRFYFGSPNRRTHLQFCDIFYRSRLYFCRLLYYCALFGAFEFQDETLWFVASAWYAPRHDGKATWCTPSTIIPKSVQNYAFFLFILVCDWYTMSVCVCVWKTSMCFGCFTENRGNIKPSEHGNAVEYKFQDENETNPSIGQEEKCSVLSLWKTRNTIHTEWYNFHSTFILFMHSRFSIVSLQVLTSSSVISLAFSQKTRAQNQKEKMKRKKKKNHVAHAILHFIQFSRRYLPISCWVHVSVVNRWCLWLHYLVVLWLHKLVSFASSPMPWFPRNHYDGY